MSFFKDDPEPALNYAAACAQYERRRRAARLQILRWLACPCCRDSVNVIDEWDTTTRVALYRDESSGGYHVSDSHARGAIRATRGNVYPRVASRIV